MYEIVKFVHICAVILWAGGSVMFLVLTARMNNDDPATVAQIAEQSEWLGPRYYMPVSLVTLAAGIWMVVDAGWGFERLWVAIGIAVVVLSAILGGAYYGKVSKAIAEGARTGVLSDEVRAKLARLRTVARAETALLFFAVFAMVTKLGD